MIDVADRFFRLSTDLLCTATPDFHFDRLSPSWCDVLGYEPTELKRQPFFWFCHPHDLGETVQKTMAMLEGGVMPAHFENRYRHKDGRYIRLSWTAAVSDETFYAVVRDVTAQKTQEWATAELGQFAYAASHDLCEPLRGILGNIDLALACERIPDELTVALADVKSGARRMQTMLDGLLDYHRIDARRTALERVALSSVVAHVAGEFDDVEVVYGALPDVNGDVLQLERLVQNILENARRFRAPDRTPTVEIRCRYAAARIAIEFCDNGVGIYPGQEERALEIFSRCHARSRFPKGEGIGLALCRRIAAVHGGSIRLTNNHDGPGLTVTVDFEAP